MKSEGMESLRIINAQISGLVGTKMLILGIIGIIAIGGVNFVSFKLLKT
jgi:site-specific recombinase